MICSCKEKKMKIWHKITPFVLLFSLMGCHQIDSSRVVYASFYPVYDFTSRIVGNLYKVESLTPPGTEPHDFELSPKKIAGIIDSKGLIVNGINIESWVDDLPKEVKNKTCVVSDGVEIRKTNGQDDPHIWLNPLNAVKEMENIANFMCQIDENNQTTYLANLANATTSFVELDNELMAIANSLAQKNIVVAHAAYGYMCDRYGLNQISINGIEPDQEPTAQTIENIIDAVNEYHITTIFTEELISSDIADFISKQCHIKVEVLSPLEEAEDGDDYISVMKENFQKIKEASND